MFEDVNEIYNKYKDYEYEDNIDFSNYHIKSCWEIEKLKHGICWDFMHAIAYSLNKKSYKWNCYFAEIHKYNKCIATHTFIIVNDGDFKYWIECAWQKHKGIHLVFTSKTIERLLKDEYNADEIYTYEYNPMMVINKSRDEFFEYLDKNYVNTKIVS